MELEEFKKNHMEGITLEDFLEAVRNDLLKDEEAFLKEFSNGLYKNEKGRWIPCIAFLNAEIRPVYGCSRDVAHAYVGRGTIKWLQENNFKRA